MNAIATLERTSNLRPRIAHFWWLSQVSAASRTSAAGRTSRVAEAPISEIFVAHDSNAVRRDQSSASAA